MEPIDLGDIVESLNGRDKGSIYIVKSIENEYVYLVDGKGKTIDKPKKKKAKHIKLLNKTCEVLKQKLTTNKSVQDAEVRRWLREETE